MIRKRHGRLNGWIGYTLARTERNGNHMPAYHRLDPGNTVFIELQNIDQGTYNFFRTLGDGIEGLTFLSASPSNPISNISGSGLGYFSAYSVIENYIVIQSNGTYKK